MSRAEESQFCAQAIVQRPAQDAAGEGVEDDGEIDEGLGQADVGDVRHPDLIEPGEDERSDQVGAMRKP